MISLRDKRKNTRASLTALFADIPRKRRAQAIRRAWELFEKQLLENDLTDTKYDEKGRIARLGTSARDRAAITRDTMESMRILADIYHKSCEHDAVIERLIAGATGLGQTQPQIHVHLAPGTGTPQTAPSDGHSSQQATEPSASGNPAE